MAMNFNATGPSYPPGRKLSKRPTETLGLDTSKNMSPPPSGFNSNDDTQQFSIPPYQQNVAYQQNQPYQPYQHNPPNPYGAPTTFGYTIDHQGGYGMPPAGPQAPNLGIPTHLFGDPMVANVAMSYGTKIMESGKEAVDREIEKYVPVTKLKYYFAVDTSYVLRKLKLLFFPFTHSDWSVKYEMNEPVPPRYEINAPDLYIPTMAYLTYVLVAGMALGTQNRFTPEVLGMLASTALAMSMVEIVAALVTLYIINLQTKLKTIDLIAYSGYKYVGIIVAVLLSIALNRTGYYVSLVYCGFTISYFLMKSLRWQVLATVVSNQDTYGNAIGNKRRMYFLLCMVCLQPVLMWWLSYHLVPPPLPALPPNLVQP